MRFLLFLSFMIFYGNVVVGQGDVSFTVFFDMDRSAITTKNRKAIADSLMNLDSSQVYEAILYGYTDFVGSSRYNEGLSERRASSLANFLIEAYGDRIIRVRHRGYGEWDSNVSAPTVLGVAEHRKVLVVLKPQQVRRLKGIANLEGPELTIGTSIILENLNFHPGRHVLLPESIPTLKKLLATLKANPRIHIRIEGHICCGIEGEPDGLDQDTGEQKLSYNRAHNIYQYLVRNGIDKKRLTFAGFGYSRPIHFPEKTEDEMRENRRVELIITKT